MADSASPDRYPGYDVLSKRDSPSWDAQTRVVLDARLAVADEPRFLAPLAWATLKALCDAVAPQPPGRPAAPLAAYVDRKLLDDRRDGWRPARLPVLREAWTRGLAALEAEAQAAHARAFADLSPADRDALVGAMQTGELRSPAWGDMPSELFFAQRAAADILRAAYAHPSFWSDIGFGGPASPRGYVRLDFDKRDPWEAAEAKPGHAAHAARENARVGR
jgi:hypothetical protein